MFRLTEYESLKSRHTFGIDVSSRYFIETDGPQKLFEALDDKRFENLPRLTIGEGSNLLFRQDYRGLILHPVDQTLKVIDNTTEYSIVEVGGGRNWDSLVEWTVENRLHGIENLSNIPGSVGAAPVQNIGAYGAEVSNVVAAVFVVDPKSKRSFWIEGEACQFGYRTSIFKLRDYQNLIVWRVRFKLSKASQLNLNYQALIDHFENKNQPDQKAIRRAVESIRSSKLPDVQSIGSAGSFFKNPILKRKQVDELKIQYPMMPVFRTELPEELKIAAAWLIESCGFKGKRQGDAGVYSKQALVLVNYGEATGEQLYTLSTEIQKAVNDKFGILLEPEVLIL